MRSKNFFNNIFNYPILSIYCIIFSKFLPGCLVCCWLLLLTNRKNRCCKAIFKVLGFNTSMYVLMYQKIVIIILELLFLRFVINISWHYLFWSHKKYFIYYLCFHYSSFNVKNTAVVDYIWYSLNSLLFLIICEKT